jgi:hypothetical protein
MIRLALLILAITIAACAPQQRCDLTAVHEISFTNANASDSITARSFGESCDQAVILYVVRDGEGAPVWSWAGALAQRFGEIFSAEDRDAVQDFLARWVQANVTTTQSAPTWDALMAGQTTLDQLTYEDIRARDLPMLCHFSATARETCVFWEPAAGAAGLFFEREVAEEL